MRLLTYRHNDREEIGALTGDGKILALFESLTSDLISPEQIELLKNCRTMLDFIQGGESGLLAVQEVLSQQIGERLTLLDPAEVEILAPIPRPPKIVAVGLNYMDHCRETNTGPPQRPLLFAKYPTSVIGHNAQIEWKESVAREVDYEAELAVIIGKRGKGVTATEAYDYVFGYTALNDVSARDLQFGDGQWIRGKSLDTFCPLGQYIVTKDEIPNPHNLRICCRVNGETLQDSNTGEMIFDIPALIEYITRSITLEPGDVIATGTPSGVGFSRKPPIFLKHDDEVEIFIEKIGSLVNRVNVIS